MNNNNKVCLSFGIDQILSPDDRKPQRQETEERFCTDQDQHLLSEMDDAMEQEGE